MQYLKGESYYSNLYDEITVERCRGVEERFLSGDVPEGAKILPKKSQEGFKRMVADIALYFYSGEQWEEKSKAVKRWMDADRKRDEKFSNAVVPSSVICPSRDSYMSIDKKDIYMAQEEEPVLFFFKCPKCSKNRVIFEGGEEYQLNSSCSKCGGNMDVKDKREESKVTFIHTCLSCGHKEKYVLDLSQKGGKEDKNFLVDKKRFRMTEKEGARYLDSRYNLNNFERSMEEQKEREANKKLYDAVANLKKLNIADLEKFLTKALEKEGYIKLDLAKPEIRRDIIINFTIQDSKESRKEYDSETTLRKLFNKNLENTNWRLMSDGIDFKLGILTGRLRGYEHEEDLLKLVGKQNEKTKAK